MMSDWFIVGSILIGLCFFLKKSSEEEHRRGNENQLAILKRTAELNEKEHGSHSVLTSEAQVKLSVDEILGRAKRGLIVLANTAEYNAYEEAKFYQEHRQGCFELLLSIAIQDKHGRYAESDVMEKFVDAANKQAIKTERMFVQAGIPRSCSDWEDSGRFIFFQVALIFCAFRTDCNESFANALNTQLEKPIFHRFWEEGEELFQDESMP
ncbi:hypothetical protein NB550_23535 [Vibrio parahaemolyticus]|uniref:hypothetical protein n=2 Tax=Vibrio parahaemolyticus TaxID=670 RepID=UPI0004AF99D2|nr:hypothetical protein [Vibrio parahaemolyticus]MCR9768585.1 hypothetical protein [Vibrio parahaemolyticus]MCR9888506.1 hypothetical protein [Vibrio parahaemolyticus]MCR9920455.1 hypothetical protein [Vibrio parahaemolyticus]MCX8784723.1 hypothetical protein [Vibrio parahaemolyticus]MCX8817210.1 hypothetical protein [Vibrio parahaemolyticus]